MSFCGKCGAKNPDDNRFCSNCGAEIIIVEKKELPPDSTIIVPKETKQNIEPVVEKINVTKTEKDKKKFKRSIPWMFVGIAVFILSFAVWIIRGALFSIVIATVSLVVGIISLIKKAKLRAFPIIGIVVLVYFLISWGIQIVINAVNGGIYPLGHVAKIGDLSVSIPEDYQTLNNEETFKSYINQSGSKAGLIYAYNLNFIPVSLDTAIQGGIKKIGNITSMTPAGTCTLAGLDAIKYEFTTIVELNEYKGLCAGTCKPTTGRFYVIVMLESTMANNKYLGEFDRIVSTANINGQNSNTITTSANTDNSSHSVTTTNKTTTTIDDSNNTYESIYNEYSTKLTSQYELSKTTVINAVSAGKDIDTLADSCAKEVDKLATISAEGIDKMADVAANRPLDTNDYMEWSQKLSTLYMQYSMDLESVYIGGVTNDIGNLLN